MEWRVAHPEATPHHTHQAGLSIVNSDPLALLPGFAAVLVLYLSFPRQVGKVRIDPGSHRVAVSGWWPVFCWVPV